MLDYESNITTTGDYLCLCIAPMGASAVAIALFMLAFHVDTPHFYRLTNSDYASVPLEILYCEDTRRNEERDYLDKMYDYVPILFASG